MSPIDLERHKPPGQQRRGPICKYKTAYETMIDKNNKRLNIEEKINYIVI
jgi:hypothetical protein